MLPLTVGLLPAASFYFIAPSRVHVLCFIKEALVIATSRSNLAAFIRARTPAGVFLPHSRQQLVPAGS